MNFSEQRKTPKLLSYPLKNISFGAHDISRLLATQTLFSVCDTQLEVVLKC